MNKVGPFYLQERFIYFSAIAASVLLSFWINYRETVINPDAICYLISAESVGKLGVKGAMHLCGQAIWPFYSVLIYSFVQLTHLSYTLTAYLLDAFFSLISVLTFILIVKELGGSKRVMWLAAAVILLSHEFNSTREYIVRDHGFWAFYLCSILLLIRYFKSPSWQTALLWNISLVIATLFRIEGAIFLLTMPFLAFFYPRLTWMHRFKSFLSLNSLTIVICLTGIAYFLLHPQKTLDQLGRVSELTAQLQNGFATIAWRYTTTKLGLAQHVLTTDSAKDAGIVWMVLMCGWYGLSIIGNLSLIYALLFLYGIRQRVLALTQSKAVLYGYLFINIAVTFTFLLERMFLSKRYLIALSLVFMLFVPFALERLWQNTNTLRQRFIFFLAILLILFSAAGGIFDFGYSKAYIHDAGDWLDKNVPKDAMLYANDYQLMYYSRHFGDDIFKLQRKFTHVDAIADGRWKQYDYIALRLDQKEAAKVAAIRDDMNRTPDKTFSNKRGDQIVIYKLR